MESNGKNSLSEGTNGKVGTKGRLFVCELVFRLVCVATTLAAAIVMGKAKETEEVPLQLTPSLPAVLVPVTAKSTYSSAFVYFIVANAIACGYSILSLGGAILNKGIRKGQLAMLIFIIDELMLALLFSGNGAAAAIGNVGENGNSHVGWNKICNVFTKFCAHVKVSVILSLVGALNYVLLALISIISLYKRDI